MSRHSARKDHSRLRGNALRDKHVLSELVIYPVFVYINRNFKWEMIKKKLSLN